MADAEVEALRVPPGQHHEGDLRGAADDERPKVEKPRPEVVLTDQRGLELWLLIRHEPCF